MTKVTGDLISIDDSAYDGFKGMTIYGKTVQNLWVNPSGTKYGITATANSNGSVTFSGTSTSQSANRIESDKIYTIKPNTAYIISIDKISTSIRWFALDFYDSNDVAIGNTLIGGTASQVTYGVFTAPSNFAYCACCAGIPYDGDSASGTYRVMLREATPEEIAKAASTPQTLPVYPDGGPDASDEELGIMPLDGVSTLADSDFDDYWCPPGLSSVDSLTHYKIGKNLAMFLEGYESGTKNGVSWEKNSDGSIHIWGKNELGTGFAIIYAAYSYGSEPLYKSIFASEDLPPKITAYCPGAGSMVYVQMNATKPGNSAGSAVVSTLGLAEPETSDTVRGCVSFSVFLGIAAYFEGDFTVYPQIELGDTATDFEKPYVYYTPIDLESNSLRSLPDGTRDELQIDAEGNCTLVKRVGNVIASDGNMSDNGGDTVRITLDGDTVKDSYNLFSDKSPILQDTSWDETKSWTISGSSATEIYCHIADNSYSETMGILRGGNIFYPLATPQTIQLGKISLPKLRKKPLVNNVWANGAASGTGFALAPEIDFEYNRWRMGCDGLKVDGQHSFWDLGGCIASRDTGTLEKKPVTATVPYMSGFYDLSDLYGAVAFESREAMYRFEFVEDSREDLQDVKSRFLKWLASVQNAELQDDDIPGRHLIGSFSEAEFEEGEEGESGSLEVTFLCQPFFEADEETVKTLSAGSNTVTIDGQAVNAYAKSSGTSTLQIGGVKQSVGTTEIRLSQQLKPGDNAVTVTGSAVTLRWRELTI